MPPVTRHIAHMTLFLVIANPVHAVGVPSEPGNAAELMASTQHSGEPVTAPPSGALPPGVHGKRRAPPDIAPVTIGNIRYSVLHFGRAEGLDQNGGYIVASDKKTGQRQWTLKVYDNHIDASKESDVQDVFITSMKKSGHHLLVQDEQGRQYLVDVKQRTAHRK